MIRHIVMWKLKEEAESRGRKENAGIIKKKLEALRGHVEQLCLIEVGVGTDLPGSTWDVVLITEFESQADLDEYQAHPMHLEAGSFIKAVTEARAAVDYIL